MTSLPCHELGEILGSGERSSGRWTEKKKKREGESGGEAEREREREGEREREREGGVERRRGTEN